MSRNPSWGAVLLLILLGLLGIASPLAAARDLLPAASSPTWVAQGAATPGGTLPMLPTILPSPTATATPLPLTATVTGIPSPTSVPGLIGAQTPRSPSPSDSAAATPAIGAGKLISAATGGSLASVDGSIVVIAPPEAMKEDFEVALTYTALSTAQRAQAEKEKLELTNMALHLTLRTASGQDIPESTMQKPLRLTVYYRESQLAGIKEDSLAIYTWDTASGRWQRAGDSRNDAAANVASSNAERAGVFLVAGTPTRDAGSSSVGGLSTDTLIIIVGVLVALAAAGGLVIIRTRRPRGC